MKTWLLMVGAVLLWLTPSESLATGACTSVRVHDWQDMGCNQNYICVGGGQATKPCPCQNQPTSHGMPQWWVSEPYINLCLNDTPLSYTMSSGKEMTFQFYYRQRTKLPDADELTLPQPNSLYSVDYPGVSNCGTNANWGNNWTVSLSVWDAGWDSYFATNGITPGYAPYSQGYQAFEWRPEGGITYYNVPSGSSNTVDPKSLVQITGVVSGQNYPIVAMVKSGGGGTANAPTADANGIYWGNTNVGVKLVNPDGSQDIFGLSGNPLMYGVPSTTTPRPTGLSNVRLLLTQQIDPQGRVTRLGYERNQINFITFRVRYVVDPDGRTNTFRYSSTSSLQLTEIDDPYGRKTSLGYNSSGWLYSITDAVTNTSSFTYQGPNGWLTNLSTPYGNTGFNFYQVLDPGETNGYNDDVEQRATYVSEPTGAQQLYFYLHINSFLASSGTSPTNIPGQTNFDNGLTNGVSGHGSLSYRNTFHWGRRQFADLSSGVQSTIGNSLSTALANLTSNDYAKADLKHWLMSGADELSITESLSSEQDPSPDPAGQIQGLRTWYNYAGKPSPELLGSSPQISCIARVLPDGSSQYTTYNYYPITGISGYPNGAGFVSDNESSYSRPDGTLGVVTNWYGYGTNSVDLINVSNSVGQYLDYGYNAGHEVIGITNALQQITTLSWDTGITWNLLGVSLPSGKQITFSYYNYFVPQTLVETNMLQQVSITPEGRSFTFNNYSAGSPISITDDRGLTVSNSWDGLNRLTATVFPDTTSIFNVYKRLDLVASKDRLSNWSLFAYDGLQHLTTYTNANNSVTSYSWCGCGSLDQIIDALTNYTTFNYDNQGNLTNIVYPDSSQLTYQFDLAGRMTNIFDPQGRHLRVAYNNQGLPITVTTANGTLQSAIYDAVNRLISLTDANGITVTNQYDVINELLKQTWPDGINERYGYSTNGLVAYTNRDLKVTFYSRDGAGRMIALTNANQEVTHFAYDSLDNIITLIDGRTNTTTWQYNEYGWLTNKLDGLTRITFGYAYNANGWVTNRWTPEKGNTGYEYDNVGNLKSITYPQQIISYAYDALNRLTNMMDGVGTTTFSYTPASQLQGETGPWTSDAMTYTYIQGLRSTLTLSQASGNWSQSYAYDAGWRMTNVVSPAGTFGYGYGFQPASPLITGISLPNGASIVNGYDTLARLRSTTLNNHWGHALDSYTYTPDPLGLRTNIVRNLGLTSSTATAGFDNIGQLTSWSAAEAGGTLRQNEQLGFGFDAAHNLHTRSNGSLLQTFTDDAANQLTGVTRTGTFTLSGATPAPATNVTVNGQPAQTYGDFTFARTNLTLANGNNAFTNIAQNVYGAAATNTLTANLPQSVTLGFDNNGNLTNDGVRTFAYDAENQLTNVFVAGQWRSDFQYDGLNRRRIVRDYRWDTGTAGWVATNAVYYVYDGNLPVQERNSNSVALVTYTRGLDMSRTLAGGGGVGGLLARTGTNGSTFYHADGVGNITALIDSQENIAARYLYNPYGKLLGQWGPLANANVMQFSSMPQHDGLALYAFRAYDPNLQRWLTGDPIGEAGGINLYGFVGNNPVNRIDTLGLFAPAPVAVRVITTTLTGTAEVGGGTAVLGALGMGAGAAILTPPVIGFLCMNPQNDPYLNPNGVNAPPNTAESPQPVGFSGTAGQYRDPDGNTRDVLGNLVKDKNGNDVKPTAGGAGSNCPNSLKPEAKYLGSKKHGLNWAEGPATANKTQTPQGQWGSTADLQFAGEQAATLAPGEGAFFDLPPGSQSIVYMPDGSTVPATRIWVRNNGTGTFHGYPLP